MRFCDCSTRRTCDLARRELRAAPSQRGIIQKTRTCLRAGACFWRAERYPRRGHSIRPRKTGGTLGEMKRDYTSASCLGRNPSASADGLQPRQVTQKIAHIFSPRMMTPVGNPSACAGGLQPRAVTRKSAPCLLPEDTVGNPSAIADGLQPRQGTKKTAHIFLPIRGQSVRHRGWIAAKASNPKNSTYLLAEDDDPCGQSVRHRGWIATEASSQKNSTYLLAEDDEDVDNHPQMGYNTISPARDAKKEESP